MELERRISGFDRTEQILVPRQRQIRVVSSLQQELHAANGDRFVDLPEQLLEAEHVSVRRPDRPIERAEVALRDADVRVVHVAIDDVRHHALGVLARPHLVGELPEKRRRRVPVQRERILAAQTLAGANGGREAGNFVRHHQKKLNEAVAGTTPASTA